MSDEDDDPVVQELDVFLNHALAGSSYLLQLPLQNAQAPTGLGKATECRIKPARVRMEFDIALDTASQNYDGESELRSETRTLKSTLVPSRANYAVGAIRGNEFHITPLQAVLQLRPSFHQVDERDTQQSEAAGTASKDAQKAAAAAAAAKADPSAAPQVYQVTIKRAETERTIERRQKSHAYLEREDKKEAWIPMELHQHDSPLAQQQRDKLFAADSSSTGEASLTADAYFDIIMPQETSSSTYDSTASDDDLSMYALQTLPLAERVLALMMHVNLIQYNWLKSLTRCEHAADADTILSVLEKEAVLVKGCWVLKSERACSSSAARLIAARDYMLLQWIDGDFIDRNQVTEQTGLPPALIGELLSRLGSKVPGSGYRFKLDPDTDFEQRFPEIARKQGDGWKQRRSQIVAAAQSGRAAPSGGPSKGTKSKK